MEWDNDIMRKGLLGVRQSSFLQCDNFLWIEKWNCGYMGHIYKCLKVYPSSISGMDLKSVNKDKGFL